MIAVKRIYEEPSQDDGLRVLVERLWPRGLSKEKARVDLWLKELAPSASLRKWFGHDPQKWQEFQRRYFEELRANEEAVVRLKREGRRGRVTLVYAAKDEQHNSAVALKQFLSGRVQ